MSVVDGGSSSGLVQRVQDILLKPKPTWDVIDGEAATVQGLFTGYICILAAIPAVATFLVSLLFGGGFAIFGLVGAAVSYGLTLVSCYVLALIIDALAPSFDGTKSQIQALKSVAYAQTAAWVGGIFNLIPVIGWLPAIAAGLYSLYLLYLGMPKLMKVPQEKAIGFTIVVIVVAIVVSFVITSVVGMVTLMGAAGAIGAAAVSSGAYH